MPELVRISRQGEILLVTITNPPVNALSPGVPESIDAAIAKAAGDEAVHAVIIIGDGDTFICGADIKELRKFAAGKERTGVQLREVLDRIEMSPVPVTCAIHGTALGGGLELAQACHYRVATVTARVGQPEVKIGLIPGAAGTQRLPRLVGVSLAAEMCASGRMVGAEEAAAAGLIDKLIEGDLREGAVAFTRERLQEGGQPPRTRDRVGHIGAPAEWKDALAALRERVRARSRGAVAPEIAIDAVEAAASLPFDEGCALEAELFDRCLHSDECRAMIHVFFGERAVNKIPDVPRDTDTIPISQAAVVGAGTMGGGIAMAYVDAGIPVILKETGREELEKGLERIQKNYEVSVKRGRLSPEQVRERMDRISGTTDYDGFMQADIVVEAVFEGLDLKKEVFSELAGVTRPDTILATNTSTLDIDAIAESSGRPEMVIGHHFFSPANVMRLLEIVRGKETGKKVIATSMALAKRLRKVGVLVGNCRGFVGNRMFGPYMREAQFLLEEGATVEFVDSAMVDFGMAMGPLAVGDLAGLDVGWRIRKEFRHTEAEGARQQTVADRLCEMGRYGQKTGAGWYRYEKGSRQGVVDPTVSELVDECAREAGIVRRDVDVREVVERTLYSLANEGARILSEGHALRASDIDIIYLNGYGFPAHRGGPMWYADTVGLDHVLARVKQFEVDHGANWEPAPFLEQLVAEGKSFADLDGE
jgi:3-hydroxyacyl-CoA dehydrogenase